MIVLVEEMDMSQVRVRIEANVHRRVGQVALWLLNYAGCIVKCANVGLRLDGCQKDKVKFKMGKE